MKRTLLAALIASFVTSANATGIPVVDIEGNIQNMVTHIEDVAKFVQQIEQLKAQLQQAQQMYNSMNGVRGMAAILNNPSARQYLPKDSATLYNLATSPGQFSSISASLNAIRAAARVIDPSTVNNSAARKSLEKQQTMLATLQATSEAGFDAAGQRFEKLQQLVETVDVAQDPKAAQDLQNRIQAEQVMMANETTKLQMMAQIQQIQQQQINQQGREQKARFASGKLPVYVTGF